MVELMLRFASSAMKPDGMVKVLAKGEVNAVTYEQYQQTRKAHAEEKAATGGPPWHPQPPAAAGDASPKPLVPCQASDYSSSLSS